MKVTLAESAGFCFGVQRALDTVYEQIGSGCAPIYTYGPIIHNEIVVEDLEKKGVRVIETRKELENLEEGTVIIRSHGVSRDIYELLEQKNLHVVDATCPFVKKIHRIVEQKGNEGYEIVITGSAVHPGRIFFRRSCRTRQIPQATRPWKKQAKSYTIPCCFLTGMLCPGPEERHPGPCFSLTIGCFTFRLQLKER